MRSESDTSRLFQAFLDSTDMVMSCPADASLAEINEQARRHWLRFPLVSDPGASLRDHLAAIDYAPASARFGPYVDNILGMNWELVSGRVVRIGERVIKSTTGYDLQRFLLHSDGRYGRAQDYVIRLRPLGGKNVRAVFRGDEAALERLRDTVLHSPWVHWFDAVNLILSSSVRPALEIEVDCADGEPAVFEECFAQLGRDSGTSVAASSDSLRDGLPVLSFKTTVTTAPNLARELVRTHGGTARVLCVNGAVQYYSSSSVPTLAPAAVAELSARCTPEGGHVMGAWAGAAVPNAREFPWAVELEAAWKL